MLRLRWRIVQRTSADVVSSLARAQRCACSLAFILSHIDAVSAAGITSDTISVVLDPPNVAAVY